MRFFSVSLPFTQWNEKPTTTKSGMKKFCIRTESNRIYLSDMLLVMIGDVVTILCSRNGFSSLSPVQILNTAKIFRNIFRTFYKSLVLARVFAWALLLNWQLPEEYKSFSSCQLTNAEQTQPRKEETRRGEAEEEYYYHLLIFLSN